MTEELELTEIEQKIFDKVKEEYGVQNKTMLNGNFVKKS